MLVGLRLAEVRLGVEEGCHVHLVHALGLLLAFLLLLGRDGDRGDALGVVFLEVPEVVDGRGARVGFLGRQRRGERRRGLAGRCGRCGARVDEREVVERDEQAVAGVVDRRCRRSLRRRW